MGTVGVVGAGIKRAGIAQIAAQAGINVLLADVSLGVVAKGKAGIVKKFDKAVGRGKLDAAKRDATEALLAPVADLEPFRDADLVIEAAAEREPVKRAIFENIGKVLAPNGILATNTSLISIPRLAQAASDPVRFIGVHFFNPVPLMPPLELIKGLATGDAALQATEEFGHRTGKTTILGCLRSSSENSSIGASGAIKKLPGPS